MELLNCASHYSKFFSVSLTEITTVILSLFFLMKGFTNTDLRYTIKLALELIKRILIVVGKS